MRYCLVVYNNDECIAINDFQLGENFPHLNTHALKDIVKFTSYFNNASELQDFLKRHHLIPEHLNEYNIGIAYYKNSHSMPDILPYGIPYLEDQEYYDPTKLKMFLMQKTQDKYFMEAFLNRYYSYLQNVPIYSDNLNILAHDYRFLQKSGYVSEYHQTVMGEFFEAYTYKKQTNGTYKRNFRSIHDLAMFCIDYLRNMQPQEPNFDVLDTELHHFQAIVKDGNITDEQEIIYMSRIQELEKEKRDIIRRREKHGTTKN